MTNLKTAVLYKFSSIYNKYSEVLGTTRNLQKSSKLIKKQPNQVKIEKQWFYPLLRLQTSLHFQLLALRFPAQPVQYITSPMKAPLAREHVTRANWVFNLAKLGKNVRNAKKSLTKIVSRLWCARSVLPNRTCQVVCLSVCLSVGWWVCLSVCLSVCVSVCLSVCLSFGLSVCLSVCGSVCLSVGMSV